MAGWAPCSAERDVGCAEAGGWLTGCGRQLVEQERARRWMLYPARPPAGVPTPPPTQRVRVFLAVVHRSSALAFEGRGRRPLKK